MHHKLMMNLLGITLAGIMSASFMPAANGATGTDFTEVRDGVAIVHPGTINTVDVGPYLADAFVIDYWTAKPAKAAKGEKPAKSGKKTKTAE